MHGKRVQLCPGLQQGWLSLLAISVRAQTVGGELPCYVTLCTLWSLPESHSPSENWESVLRTPVCLKFCNPYVLNCALMSPGGRFTFKNRPG